MTEILMEPGSIDLMIRTLTFLCLHSSCGVWDGAIQLLVPGCVFVVGCLFICSCGFFSLLLLVFLWGDEGWVGMSTNQSDVFYICYIEQNCG